MTHQPPDTLINHKEVIVTLYNEILNKRRWDALRDIVSGEFHGENGANGPDAFATPLKRLVAAFSDAEWHIKEIAQDGDMVIVIQELTGTHTGRFQNYEATGNAIVNSGIAIYYFKGKKIVRTHLQNDRLGFLQQIDVLPLDLNQIRKP